MNREEAIKFGKLIIEIAEQCDDKESEHTIEFTKLAVESLENQKSMVKELEKIKAELKELDVEPDGIHFWRANRHETINVVLHIINNHIKELKGENNE